MRGSSRRQGGSPRRQALRKRGVAKPAEHLFDAFLMVQLEPAPGGVGHVPRIVHRYPPAGAPGASELPRDLELFCHPDAERTKARRRMQSEEYTFVLTAADGGRVFGFCRRALPPGVGGRFDAGARLPETLCFIGRRPYFQLFSHLLAVALSRRWLAPSTASAVAKGGELDALLKAAHSHAPFPMPGELFTLRPRGSEHELRLLRPNEGEVSSMHESVHLRELLLRLAPQQLILLISALLCERRIVMLSHSVHTLSACIHAAIALLYPFTWEHILVPVLPRALLSYACAPMPFVVGVQTALLSELQEQPLSGIVFVDLERGTVVTTDDHDDGIVLPMCGSGGAAPLCESGGFSTYDSYDSAATSSGNPDDDDADGLGFRRVVDDEGASGGAGGAVMGAMMEIAETSVGAGGGGGSGGGSSTKKLGGRVRALLGTIQDKVQDSVLDMSLSTGLGQKTAGQLLARELATITNQTRAKNASAYVPNKDMSTALVAFFLHIFGDHTTYCARRKDGSLQFDRELFLRRRQTMDGGDSVLGDFLRQFHGAQMFEVFAEAQIRRLEAQDAGELVTQGAGGLFARAALALSSGFSKDFSVGSVRKVLRRLQQSETDPSDGVREIVLELTSNSELKEASGRTQWQLIARLGDELRDARHCAAAIALLRSRIADSSGWNWRHGVKACTVFATLLTMPGASEALLPAALDSARELQRLMLRESELAGKVPGFPADAPARVRQAARTVYILAHDWMRLTRARRFCGRLHLQPYALPIASSLRLLTARMPTQIESDAERQQPKLHEGGGMSGGAGMSVASVRRRRRICQCSFDTLHRRLRPPSVTPCTSVPNDARSGASSAANDAQQPQVTGGGHNLIDTSWATLPDEAEGGTWATFGGDHNDSFGFDGDGFGDGLATQKSVPADDGFGDAFSTSSASGGACSTGTTTATPAATAPASDAALADDGFSDAFSAQPITATNATVPDSTQNERAAAVADDGFCDMFSSPVVATSGSDVPKSKDSACGNTAADDGFGDAFSSPAVATSGADLIEASGARSATAAATDDGFGDAFLPSKPPQPFQQNGPNGGAHTKQGAAVATAADDLWNLDLSASTAPIKAQPAMKDSLRGAMISSLPSPMTAMAPQRPLGSGSNFGAAVPCMMPIAPQQQSVVGSRDAFATLAPMPPSAHGQIHGQAQGQPQHQTQSQGHSSADPFANLSQW